MSFIAFTVRPVNNQAWRICGDTALRIRINQFIQKKFKGDVQRGAEARTRLLNHPGIVFSDAESAVERERILWAERGRKMLDRLRWDLKNARRIAQHLPRGATGQMELTWKKTVSHSQRVLPVSEDWLLFSLERHPHGGLPPVKLQYWLYHLPTRDLFFLADKTVAYGNFVEGFAEIMFGLGDPDRTLVEDWFRQAEELLGADASDKLHAAITLPRDELCVTSFYDILNGCVAITGIQPVSTTAGRFGPLDSAEGSEPEFVMVMHGLGRHPYEVPDSMS